MHRRIRVGSFYRTKGPGPDVKDSPGPVFHTQRAVTHLSVTIHPCSFTISRDDDSYIGGEDS